MANRAVTTHEPIHPSSAESLLAEGPSATSLAVPAMPEVSGITSTRTGTGTGTGRVVAGTSTQRVRTVITGDVHQVKSADQRIVSVEVDLT